MGVVGLIGYVAAWDFMADETITSAVHRALDSRVGRVAVPIVLGVTGAHLTRLLPREYDPFYKIAEGVEWVTTQLEAIDKVFDDIGGYYE